MKLKKMVQATSKTRGIAPRHWIGMLAVVCLAMAALLWWQPQSPIAGRPSAPGGQANTRPAGREKEIRSGAPEATERDAEIEQARNAALAQLAEAAKAVPVARPIAGTVVRRPAFVAEFEWDMLQTAAHRTPDKEKELTLLVNKLLFFKKYALWRSLVGSEADGAARHALAREVLAMMPEQIRVLGPEQAGEMELELLADLKNR